ncbi:MAG: hypothetical protein C0592_01220 [Marinilabiliales bacterium]|nr:MAG: hypothetical protein C0592_01220 [Marinilabiliales bacterium]
MEKDSAMNKSIFNEWKFPTVIILMLAGLVVSKWLLSLSQMILFILIITDKGGIRRQINAFKNPLVLILISVFFLHAAGLLWSDDISYGFRDIRNKIQLLTFPAMIAAIPIQNKSKSVIILKSFVLFMGLMSAINLVRYFTIPHSSDFQAALWHSHIRFSIMLCFSMFSLLWLFVRKFIAKAELIPAILLMVISGVSLIFLESFTGLVIFGLLLPFSALLHRKNIRNKSLKIISVVILLIISLGFIYTVYSVKSSFFPNTAPVKLNEVEKHTPSGNVYKHDTISTLNENGNLVYLYICREEIEQEWEKRSSMPLYKDSLWQGNILIRYLSSRGFRKDSTGIWQLTEQDITNIENKIPNYRLENIDPVRKRLYMFFWELNVYKNSNDPSGHSLTQRLEYWKAARLIIEENFWTGVGTGDVKAAFAAAYQKMNSLLDDEFRLRAHNQYLTFWVTFGVFGLILFLFSILYPVFIVPQRHNILYIGFIFIFLLSMLNEDTLETQVGLSFYALFNSLFLFVLISKDFIHPTLKK